jgi:hypothetical protein
MPDSGEQNSSSEAMNFILGLLGIVFAILNVLYGLWGIHYSISENYFYSATSFYGIIILEGILLIVSVCVMIKKLNHNALLFIPILTGIITIIIGVLYVNRKLISNDISGAAIQSKLIIGGLLLIITSFIIIKNANYKSIVFISIIFVIISVLIDFFNFSKEIKYYSSIGAKIISIQIAIQILLIIVFFTIVMKRQDYKYGILIPIIFGINNVFIASVRISYYYRGDNIVINIIQDIAGNIYGKDNDIITLIMIIFGGFQLIFLLFKILNKFGHKIILAIPIPFGILNIIYAFDKINNGYFFHNINYIFILMIIFDGVLLIIIPFWLIKKFNGKILIK